MLIRCNDLSSPIEFLDCPEVLETLRASVAGWSLSPWSNGETAVPRIRVVRDEDQYRLESPWLDGPIREPSAVSAVCSLIVDIINQRVNEDPALVCLHAGAIRFGDRVLIFPSTYRAGKSTLIARLAMSGYPVVSDDVLPIIRDSAGLLAVAPGVAPRLRLPLQSTFGSEFRAFAETRRGPDDGYYRYLSLPPTLLAPHGQRFGIGGFVFLDRDEAGIPMLTPVDCGKALQRLLMQNFGRAAPAGDILDRFTDLVMRCGSYRLRYSNLDAAARLLSEAFGDWRPEAVLSVADDPIADSRDEVLARPARLTVRLSDRVVQSDGIGVRRVGSEVFLTDDGAGSIFGLDGIGPAVWELIHEPISAGEVVDIVAESFPGIDRKVISNDVVALIDELLRRSLTVRVDPDQPTT